ncbi:hypothetical protein CJU89_4643 [Yarrowia sp. B02]|nr:hypothetical protein CJU89_4643 [Yarrowia sp. B02]
MPLNPRPESGSSTESDRTDSDWSTDSDDPESVVSNQPTFSPFTDLDEDKPFVRYQDKFVYTQDEFVYDKDKQSVADEKRNIVSWMAYLALRHLRQEKEKEKEIWEKEKQEKGKQKETLEEMSGEMSGKETCDKEKEQLQG